ncbi:hypothetical protein EMCRGX_G027786 [Ephydatia muelleri]|eukprot:Em0020g823a
MSVLVSRLAAAHYLKLVRKEGDILHYKRSPTWRSLVIFIVLLALTHVISTQAEFWYLGALCYALGVYFCYIGTEKYEECIFDKSKKTVTLMSARFLEKHILGYRRKIVTELEEIVGVSVESHKIAYAGTGHQVVLLFLSGLTLSLTAQCTYGDKSEHETVMATIKQFLGFNIPSKDEDEEPRTKRRQQEKGKVTKMKLKKTE